MRANYAIFKKLPKANNRPNGEISPKQTIAQK
jgi:hypothetical protein